jgi:hypothetical protein
MPYRLKIKNWLVIRVIVPPMDSEIGLDRVRGCDEKVDSIGDIRDVWVHQEQAATLIILDGLTWVTSDAGTEVCMFGTHGGCQCVTVIGDMGTAWVTLLAT